MPGTEPVSVSENLVGKDQTLQFRVVAADATGATVLNEGPALKQADVSTITRTIYDLDGATPSTPTSTDNLTVSTVIIDTLTVALNWGKLDAIGRNFVDTIPGSKFPTAGHTYRVLYEVTTTGGGAAGWYHHHLALNKAPS